ncbi:hypothetical protein OEZ86_007388 [Tetradesmus obliquus]|nr:hypothetical protein OEZ86_007388 [Tetradesmus obliquus]
MRHQSRRWTCGLVILLALLGHAAAAAEPAGKHPGKQQPEPEQQQRPVAWAWISQQPQLSSIAGILTLIGADKQLSGPFTGTLLLPTNEAVAEYASRLQAPLQIADTDALQPFWKLFFSSLIDYHVLLARVYAKQWEASRQHSTRYFSSNGLPHSVTFLANSSCTPVLPSRAAGSANPKAAGSRRGKAGKAAPPTEPCRSVAVQDEQGNNVTFAEARTAVQGGGVIHTVNAVLQPNDIFPSLAAVLAAMDFSDLSGVLQQIDAGLNITVLADLEKTPGTLAAPTNEAFIGLDLSGAGAATLLRIVTYHFCPDTQPWKLVYTPFTSPTKRNPCITLLGRTTGQAALLQLTYKQQSSALDAAPDMWVSYPTSAGNNTVTVNSTATIVMADITVPLHVVHAVSKLLLPPS